MKTQKEKAHENMVTTDHENENGEHPEGKTVHLSTVTHAWRGVLAYVTPSYYVLQTGAVLVALTGQTGGKNGYGKTGAGQEEDEPCVGEVRVLRGAVAWLIVLP